MTSIAGQAIGAGRTYVIAEIGNNHNGSLDRAIHMVDLALETGVDCVKFQVRKLDQVYRRRSLRREGEDLGTEYILDLLDRFELGEDQHRKLAAYCVQRGIPYLCTPWDPGSASFLESLGVPAYKVASADLTNLPLIERLASFRKPLILSTGMSTVAEIRVTTEFLRQRGAEFVLLHCNSTYPAPLHDINLRFMATLRRIHPLVGYSGHERGTAVTLAAVALGAIMVERHFTLDRGMEGPDHAASLEVDELRRLVAGIREIEQALGEETAERRTSQGEMINRENLAKSLVAARPLRAGQVIGPDDVSVRSPGQGLSPQAYDRLVGRVLERDMAEEDFFFPTDIGVRRAEPRRWKLRRPWGVPVRYHDFKRYLERIQPDLFEFHLSYTDMELDPAGYLAGPYSCGFVVHAPELFAGSHLMDLAAPDAEYHAVSMRETQRVIDITRSLKRFFPATARPLIVANVGGFSMDAPLPEAFKADYYARLADSLRALDTTGVEIIPQTMAPFPWHFGGQRYQNLLVRPDEIVRFCTAHGMRMCFDVSHSWLACQHLGLDFYDFARQVAPHTAHLHLGDARGVNGEGLQVGEGDIDFPRLAAILDESAPHASFIPEIWQGHKNDGEGFWLAMDRLAPVFGG